MSSTRNDVWPPSWAHTGPRELASTRAVRIRRIREGNEDMWRLLYGGSVPPQQRPVAVAEEAIVRLERMGVHAAPIGPHERGHQQQQGALQIGRASRRQKT